MRTIKYNAWIPDLEIMLKDVTVYHSGTIGMDDEDFKKVLPKNHNLFENGVFHEDEDNDIFDHVLDVLEGEDWIWIDQEHCVILQYSEINDSNKKEIFDGDIHLCEFQGVKSYMPIVCENGAFWLDNSFKKDGSELLLLCEYGDEPLNIVGNRFENAELLETNQ